MESSYPEPIRRPLNIYAIDPHASEAPGNNLARSVLRRKLR